MDVLAFPLRILVRAYQLSFAAFWPGVCRFHPSCSAYAMEAIETHGGWRGAVLAARRLLRCHPFGGAGYDPVPGRREA